MAQPLDIMVLAGDGIGAEVMAEAIRVFDWFAQWRGFNANLRHEEFGADAYRRTGRFMREEAFADLLKSDAILFGAFGGTLEANPIPPEIRRKFGLLRIRRDMGLFANVRPIRCSPALVNAAPLRPEITREVDFVIIRELIGGIYFGEPRGITDLGNGEKRGVNTQVYTSSEIKRVGQYAFELAARRRKNLTSVDKSNVMESGQLWREEMNRLSQNHPEVALNHLYVDACAAELMIHPRRFDVLVTDNLFGDILSDAASPIAGSLGMLPSASFGAPRENGVRPAFYEPVHGSAPDIAGKGIANPCGAILSIGMALEGTFGRSDDAALLQRAVDAALAKCRTADIKEDGLPTVSTRDFGSAVLDALQKLRASTA
jgi:3-isopropylmalate dehydrogenase